MDPRVSVLMAVHNAADSIAGPLDSLLAQTFRDFEVIVVDDASTDRTAKVLANGAANEGRLRVLRNPKRIGIAASLNRALTNARGTYVARQDLDAIALPQRFARQVAHLDAHPETGLLGASFFPKDPTNDAPPAATQPHFLEWTSLFQNPITPSSAMARRDVVRAAGGYDERLHDSADHDLWSRVAQQARVEQLGDPLLILDGSRAAKDSDGENRDGRRVILARYSARILGRPASSEEIDALMMLATKGPLRTGRDVRTASRLIFRFYDAFIARHGPPAPERALIRADAQARLQTLNRTNAFRHPIAILSTPRTTLMG